jgi:hypothetical protein
MPSRSHRATATALTAIKLIGISSPERVISTSTLAARILLGWPGHIEGQASKSKSDQNPAKRGVGGGGGRHVHKQFL